MLFSTTSQFVVLALLLIIGWLFGFVSHPGGDKWRRRYQEEDEKYAAYRSDADTEMREAKGRIADLEGVCASLEQRNATAEATIAELKERLDSGGSPPLPAPVPPPTEPDQEPPTRKRSRPVAEENAAPAIFGKGPNEGRSDPGSNDDLTRIRGIDPALSTRLCRPRRRPLQRHRETDDGGRDGARTAARLARRLRRTRAMAQSGGEAAVARAVTTSRERVGGLGLL